MLLKQWNVQLSTIPSKLSGKQSGRGRHFEYCMLNGPLPLSTGKKMLRLNSIFSCKLVPHSQKARSLTFAVSSKPKVRLALWCYFWPLDLLFQFHGKWSKKCRFLQQIFFTVYVFVVGLRTHQQKCTPLILYREQYRLGK